VLLDDVPRGGQPDPGAGDAPDQNECFDRLTKQFGSRIAEQTLCLRIQQGDLTARGHDHERI